VRAALADLLRFAPLRWPVPPDFGEPGVANVHEADARQFGGEAAEGSIDVA
jgi:hypothetical protein